jgi:PAS domain S-box-containing protein
MASPSPSDPSEGEERAWREQLTRIVDACAVGISVHTPDGRISFANPEAAKILGVTRGVLVGKRLDDPIWTVTTREDTPFPTRSRAYARALRSGEPVYDVEFILKRPDGTIVNVSETAAPLRSEGGPIMGIVSSFTDITKRKRAEAELKSNLRHFESIGAINNLISGETQIDRMMSRVLGLVLDILECDRAWLFFPADPDVAFWRVPMERTRPEYPGAFASNKAVPMAPDVALVIKTAVAIKGPVVYDQRTGRPVPETVAEQFAVKSQILEAIYPKLGKPWLFGLHQCSHPRIWSNEDIRLFHEIGYRINDSLSVLLSFQGMQKIVANRKKTGE